MSIADSAVRERLSNVSIALQSVLGAILATARGGVRSPVELLREITTSADWAWLQPLYGLIADIDHAVADSELVPVTEVAAIGAHARALLSSGTQPAERAFHDRYRPLLQADPPTAMAHGQAMQALQQLPPEAVSEAERLHAHHQWNERRAHYRAPGRNAPARNRSSH